MITTEEQGRVAFNKAFLGQEFLTWLYFVCLSDRGVSLDLSEITIQVPGEEARDPGDERQLLAGKGVRLKSIDGDGHVTIASRQLEDSGVLLQAVRQGQNIARLGLCVTLGHSDFTLTLDDKCVVSGLKLPELFTQEDEQEQEQATIEGKKPKKRRPKLPTEDVLDLRLQLTDLVDAMVQGLYSEFMTRRLDPVVWHRDSRAMMACVQEGLAKKLTGSLPVFDGVSAEETEEVAEEAQEATA